MAGEGWDRRAVLSAVAVAVSLVAAGCGGASVRGDEHGAESAGGAPSVGAPSIECTPRDDPNGWREGDGCSELGRLAITEFAVLGGGSEVSPGAELTVRFSMSDVSGYGFDAYPGMLLRTDSPHVVFPAGLDGGWNYALLACDSYSSNLVGRVSADAPRGTLVRVTASVASLNQDCPDAPSAVLELRVR
jgi:hypothetical protein